MKLRAQVGSTITNGSTIVRFTEWSEERNGWIGLFVSMHPHGDLTGTGVFVPHHELPGWRNVPFEWQVCPGGQEEERYVWGKGCRWLERETRPVSSRSTVGRWRR